MREYYCAHGRWRTTSFTVFLFPTPDGPCTRHGRVEFTRSHPLALFPVRCHVPAAPESRFTDSISWSRCEGECVTQTCLTTVSVMCFPAQSNDCAALEARAYLPVIRNELVAIWLSGKIRATSQFRRVDCYVALFNLHGSGEGSSLLLVRCSAACVRWRTRTRRSRRSYIGWPFWKPTTSRSRSCGTWPAPGRHCQHAGGVPGRIRRRSSGGYSHDGRPRLRRAPGSGVERRRLQGARLAP